MMTQETNSTLDFLSAFALGNPSEEVKKQYLNIQEGDVLHCQVGYIFDFGHVVDAEVIVLKIKQDVNNSQTHYLCLGKCQEGGVTIFRDCVVHKDGCRLYTTKILYHSQLIRFLGMSEASGIHAEINRHMGKYGRLKPFEMFKLSQS